MSNTNQNSRVKNSMINISASIITGVIVGLLSMFRLRLFVLTFGDEINGFFNLTTSATATLNFVEAGLSTIFIQKMYTLFALERYTQIHDLYHTVRSIMKWVVIIMFGLTIGYGCLTIYQYHYLFGLTNTTIIYFLLMIPHVLSTYLGLPNCLARADQKGYIATYVIQGGLAFCYLVQIIIMVLFPSSSPMVMAWIIFILTVLPVLISRSIVKHKYQFIFDTPIEHRIDRNEIYTKMKDSFWGSLARSINLSLDNMMIAYVLPVSNTLRLGYISILSIYNGVISFVKNIVVAIVTQVNASYGNLFAKERSAAGRVFEIYFTVSCCITFIVYLSVYIVIDQFCVLFYGSNQVMEPRMLVLLIINNILFILKYVVTMVPISVCGNFHLDRNVRLFEVLCNLVLSYLLMMLIGINGLFLGTFIAQVIVCTVYMHAGAKILSASTLKYIGIFILYGGVGLIAVRLGQYIFESFLTNSIILWFMVSCLVFFVIGVIFIAFTLIQSRLLRLYFKEMINKMRSCYK